MATRKRLIEVRESKGLLQREVAEKVGISRSFYTNIEAGKYTPSLQVAKKIARVLGKHIEELF